MMGIGIVWGIIGILSKNYDAIEPHCISFK
jgi:hypothetical protein